MNKEVLTEKNRLDKIKYQAEQNREEAKGKADARITEATAEATAIKIQAEAITKQWGQEYVELKKIEKWNWQLPTVSAGDSWIILQLQK